MDLRDRRELNKGFGDGLSRAFELTLTPLIVGGIGFLLDRWLGTGPILVVVFALWGVVATTYLAWLRYDNEMKELEREREADGAAPRRRGRSRSIATTRPGLGGVDG